MKSRFLVFFIFSYTLLIGQAAHWVASGEKLNKESQFDQSLELFVKAYDFYKEHADVKGQVNASLGLGYAYINLHKVPESIAQYKVAYTLAQQNKWLEEEKEAADALSSMLFLTGQPQDALSYAQRCVELGLVLKDDTFYSTKLMELGYLHFQLGSLDSADLYLHNALKIKQELHDVDGAIIVQNYLGEFYKSIGDLEKAQDLNFLNLKHWIHLKDSTKLITTYFNISSIFFEMEDFNKSETYANESLNLAVALNLVLYKSFGIKRLAEISVVKGETDLALQQYNRLIEIYEVTDHKTRMVDVLLKVAAIYLDRSELVQSSSYIDKAKIYAEQTEDLRTKIKLILAESSLYTKQGNYKSALTKALLAYKMSSDASLQTLKSNATLLISESYAGLGKTAQALKWHKTYSHLRDSLSQVNQQSSIHELETKYRVSQKQEEIQKLNTENELADLRLKSASRKQILLIGGMSFLGFIAAISYFFYHTKKRDNALLEEKNAIIKVALDEKELLVQEIHHRVKNNLQTISSLLNMQTFNLENPEALAAIKEGEARIKSISLIHESLYKTESGINLKASEYMTELAVNLFNSYNINQEARNLELEIAEVNLDLDRMIALGLILNELLSNALKHAFAKDGRGVIFVKLTNEKETISLHVGDNGRGIPVNYLEKKTLGFQIVKDFVKKLNGKMIVNNSGGTVINIRFPKNK